MLFLIQFLSTYTCSSNKLEKTKTKPKKRGFLTKINVSDL